MKPAAFEYRRPASLEEALADLGWDGGLALPLAGGQSLVPLLNLRLTPADRVVDITRVPELGGVTRTGRGVRYGALTRHFDLEDGRVEDPTRGLLAHVAARIAYRAIRTRGTLGGSLALADPAADWLVAAVALDASVRVAGAGGAREIAAGAFCLGAYFTALEVGELVHSVEVPRLAEHHAWGYCKVAPKAGDFATSLAIAVLDRRGASARIALGAIDGAPLLLPGTAAAAVEGRDGGGLAGVARAELAAARPDIDDERLGVHAICVARSIEDARRR